MDPDACLSMILSSLAGEEWIGAAQHAENLRNWLEKGGFPPGAGKLRESSIYAFIEWVIIYSRRYE